MIRARPALPRPSTALVVILAGLPFLPSLNASFLADDWFFVAAYRHMEEPFGSLVWRALTSLAATPTTFFRPLPFMSLAAQLRLGHDAMALHIVNVILHVMVAVFVCVLARRLTGRDGLAVVTALFFAWFPRRVEAVAWLSCRPDLLAALCACGALAATLRFLDTRHSTWGVIAIATWWLAMLSKESAILVGLGCVAVLLGATRTSDGTASRDGVSLWWTAAFLVSMPVFLVCRRLVVGAWVGGYGAEAIAPGPGTLVSAAKHVAYQVVPPLEWLEPLVRTGSGSAAVSAIMAVLTLALAFVLWRARSQPAVRLGAIWTVLLVLPVMALPVSLTTTFNDRLLYLPAVGVALILAGVLARATTRGVLVTLVVVTIASGVATHQLSERWSLAGEVSDRLIASLAREVTREPASRIYLAAVPDSIGGAYLLRNGVREALALAGAPRPERVAVLSWYFVSPDVPARPVVHARRLARDSVALESATAEPQLIVGTPDARNLVRYEAAASTDRLGRRANAEIHAREPGVFWLVTADAVRVIEDEP